MRQKSSPPEAPSERLVRDIRRATRQPLRGEVSIAELCRREGIAESLYYSWSKEFLEAGKRRLAGDTELGAAVFLLSTTYGASERRLSAGEICALSPSRKRRLTKVNSEPGEVRYSPADISRGGLK